AFGLEGIDCGRLEASACGDRGCWGGVINGQAQMIHLEGSVCLHGASDEIHQTMRRFAVRSRSSEDGPSRPLSDDEAIFALRSLLVASSFRPPDRRVAGC